MFLLKRVLLLSVVLVFFCCFVRLHVQPFGLLRSSPSQSNVCVSLIFVLSFITFPTREVVQWLCDAETDFFEYGTVHPEFGTILSCYSDIPTEFCYSAHESHEICDSLVSHNMSHGNQLESSWFSERSRTSWLLKTIVPNQLESIWFYKSFNSSSL